MPPSEGQIETTAKMLAAAYWRGRLHVISTITPLTDPAVIEGMIEAAAAKSIETWRASARALLNMVR